MPPSGIVPKQVSNLSKAKFKVGLCRGWGFLGSHKAENYVELFETLVKY